MSDLATVEADVQAFELAQRQAKLYASSSLVPKQYQNNIPNTLIAQNMARRTGADLLQVMQNLYVVHGKPAWTSQFLIATFNVCGRFTTIQYRMTFEKGKPIACIAHCEERATGTAIEGCEVTLQMARDEGWVKNSKWQTMPGLMLRYRAATFLIRPVAPEISMGLHTVEEVCDETPDINENNVVEASDLNEALIEHVDEHIADDQAADFQLGGS